MTNLQWSEQAQHQAMGSASHKWIDWNDKDQPACSPPCHGTGGVTGLQHLEHSFKNLLSPASRQAKNMPLHFISIFSTSFTTSSLQQKHIKDPTLGNGKEKAHHAYTKIQKDTLRWRKMYPANLRSHKISPTIGILKEILFPKKQGWLP